MDSSAKSREKDAFANSIEKRDAYAALRLRDFRLFLSGHLISTLVIQMQTTAVGWRLYEKTNSELALGMVGLVQIVPILGLALPAGQVADRFDRRKILATAITLSVTASLGLAAVNMWASASVRLIYACLFLNGVARAFQSPARSSLMPQLVPKQNFSNAVSWYVSGFELSSMAGPALAGWLIYMLGGVTPIYALAGLGNVFYLVMLANLTRRSYAAESRDSQANLKTLVAGLRYVWNTKLLLGAMSLDMFAVLFGGAVALLPVYAKDVLGVGPAGFGALQAAPSLGAITMAMLTAHLPPFKKAGRTLLWAVAGFGMTTIAFGLSRNFWLSLAMLFLTGAFDNISVVIRQTLETMLTPDEMRGRVSAVNGMFISASNELGRFESGGVAALFGPVFSVVGGGLGTLIVVATVAISSPQLRRFGRLDNHAK
ncbi:MAG TPA: MFS transporter [Blastocatellia bacterium]